MTPTESSSPSPSSAASLRSRPFVLLLALVSVAFAAVVGPFLGAAFWGVVLAIVFMPLCGWLKPHLRNSRPLAAVATLAIIFGMVVLPIVGLVAALTGETTALYQRLQSGQIDFAQQFEQLTNALPSWLQSGLERVGLGDFGALTRRLGALASQGGRALAARALDVGQNTLDLVVGFVVALYLAFFLLRDGRELVATVREALPLDERHKRRLFERFTVAVRATVKGNILVAAAQGALGGLAFWVLGVSGPILWAVVMAFLSLVPAVGAGLIWAPVAIWLVATGSVAKGIGLVAYGVLVIGLVDNLLRPVLVGADIRMPDWLVLLTTLGGLAVFGINGFVIGPVVGAMFLAVWGIVLDERRSSVD